MEQHAFIFEGGDVDGGVDEVACERAGIKVQPGLNPPVIRLLRRVWFGFCKLSNPQSMT